MGPTEPNSRVLYPVYIILFAVIVFAVAIKGPILLPKASNYLHGLIKSQPKTNDSNIRTGRNEYSNKIITFNFNVALTADPRYTNNLDKCNRIVLANDPSKNFEDGEIIEFFIPTQAKIYIDSILTERSAIKQKIDSLGYNTASVKFDTYVKGDQIINYVTEVNFTQ